MPTGVQEDSRPSATDGGQETPQGDNDASEPRRRRRDPSASSCPSSASSSNGPEEAVALMLRYSNVEFARYLYVDLVNQLRCKVVPIDQFLLKNEQYSNNAPPPPSLNVVAFAAVVMGGLPSYGDVCVSNSGYDASGTVYLHPDLSTLRILPYSPKSCLLMGSLRTFTTPGSPTSDLCTRSILQSILGQLDRTWGLGLNVGFELEFCLYDRTSGRPVDFTNFASTTPLNRCESFLSMVTTQLKQQGIVVELLHAESAHGQFELVLKYRSQVVRAVDDAYRAQETIANVSHSLGLQALFLPKMNMIQAGSGLHLHLSLYRTQPSQPSSTHTSSLQSQQESFVEGVLLHLPALLALSLPTANSFRRVGPGCWTGSSVRWAIDDKESPIRVMVANKNDDDTNNNLWEHCEYKLCDATANLYLALSGIVLAGLHGLELESTLRPPSTTSSPVNESSAADAAFPTTIEQALDALEADMYLREKLPQSLVRAYLALRRSEAERAATMTLEDEVQEAMRRA